MSSKNAAALLRSLANKIEKGKVVLIQGKNETILKVPQRVEVEIKAEKETGRKKTTKKIEVEIEWAVGDVSKAAGVEIR